MTLTVPAAATEVRLGTGPQAVVFETNEAGEQIETALDKSGVLQLQWRPQVAEVVVDQGLTVDSHGVMDVQEDGLRLQWAMGLRFRSGQRETFDVRLPQGWLVETVTGDNVRGWTVKQAEDRQRVAVTLLKPARGSERIVLQLANRTAIGLA